MAGGSFGARRNTGVSRPSRALMDRKNEGAGVLIYQTTRVTPSKRKSTCQSAEFLEIFLFCNILVYIL